ncbi:MAG TPA: hypothetical protein VGI42_03640 [Chthoniobacterales bacterium]|jgi:hypothetical protein
MLKKTGKDEEVIGVAKPDERRHFYCCETCREMVDKRDLDAVFFHETGHKPRPDIQYGGSERLN